ncbi:hypothetical protein GCM10007111_44210 [Virgibacillus kapii]|uniref:Uncharacterized protein n=1 Tax=Virgibacillus kapii TaxID=1638645 RepID=A0ABQ2E0R3_9BACI|nr:hypothetical protein GCM10007111_44210 [Virgibacillus kapii]
MVEVMFTVIFYIVLLSFPCVIVGSFFIKNEVRIAQLFVISIVSIALVTFLRVL